MLYYLRVSTMVKIEDVIAIIITILVTVYSLKTNYNSGVSDNISVEENNEDVILSKIKNGRYCKNTHASYYSAVHIYENERGRFVGVVPQFDKIRSVSNHTRIKVEGDCLIAGEFRFKVIDENTLQYVKPESPNERQDWIADGSLYIYQEEP